jgi:hypothetical protein
MNRCREHKLLLVRMALLAGVLLAGLVSAGHSLTSSAQQAAAAPAGLNPSLAAAEGDAGMVGEPSSLVLPGEGILPRLQVDASAGTGVSAAVQDVNCPIAGSVRCYVDQGNMEEGDGSPGNPFYKFDLGYDAATDLADQYGIPAEVIIDSGTYLASGVYDQPALLTRNSGTATLEHFQSLLGNTACTPGERDCNTCVTNVVGAFQSLPNHSEVMGFYLGAHPPPPFDLDIGQCGDLLHFEEFWSQYHGHWQGVQRLAGAAGADGRYLIVDRDKVDWSGMDYSGFAVVRLDASQPTGRGPFGSNRVIGGAPTAGDSVDQTVYISSNHTHPGGIQVIGDFLIVGTGPIVWFYDLADPAGLQPNEPAMGTLPDRGEYSGSTTAMAQLEDGRYLLVISSSDAESVDFYISDEPDVLAVPDPSDVSFSRLHRSSNGWNYCDNWWAWHWDSYQSIDLVTDCSGTLYLVATGNWDLGADCNLSCQFGKPCCPDGTNHADLHRIDISGNDIVLTWVAEASFPLDTTDPENGCNFDAAAGVYVDDNHRLYLYCTEHAKNGDGYVRFRQYGPVP